MTVYPILMHSVICLTLALGFESVGPAEGSLENEELGHLFTQCLISKIDHQIFRPMCKNSGAGLSDHRLELKVQQYESFETVSAIADIQERQVWDLPCRFMAEMAL